MMNTRVDRADALAAGAGLVMVLGVLIASPVGDIGPIGSLWSGRHLLVQVFLWAVFGVALGLLYLARRAKPVRVGLIVLVAVLCQLPGLMNPPTSSSDAYRYVLDGRTQLAGISPYRYVPLDDHLARLRDPIIFPGLTPQQHSGVTTPDLADRGKDLSALTAADPRTVINRPGVPTIYPPVAEAYFAAVAAVTPWSAGTRGLQLASALMAVLITAAVALVLRRRHRDPLPAVFFGWVPLTLLETGNGAHVDILAAALIVAAMLVLNRPGARARVAGGVLLGMAIATKILPLLLLPAVTVLRRRHGGGWRWLQVGFSSAVTVAASYVPHVLVAGALVLGYLPGYLNEEGFDSGSQRYAGLALIVPRHLRQPVALALLVVLALAALWQARQRRPELVAVWLFGGSLLISTPAYTWYLLPLLALAALAVRPEWIAVVMAVQWAALHPHMPATAGWGYAIATVVVIATALLRRRHDRATVHDHDQSFPRDQVIVHA